MVGRDCIGMNGKGFVKVRFLGDRSLLRALVTGGNLKPQRRGGRIFFQLAEIKTLVDRVAELETLLAEISATARVKVPMAISILLHHYPSDPLFIRLVVIFTAYP